MIGDLVPREANNDYRGSRIALYVFVLLALVILGRSLIHFLKPDAGLNSIATIITFSGSPDPNRVIHLFGSLWGSQQLITVMIYAVVLARYRNLVPLMYALLVVETLFRMISGSLHRLTPDYFAHTPPGAVGNLPMLALGTFMLVLSLRRRESL